MEIKTGYLYHIKDEFFDKIDEKLLCLNKREGNKWHNKKNEKNQKATSKLY